MIYSFKTENNIDKCGLGFDFDITLVPDQRFYCFIGENGVGKTQLLEMMAKIMFLHHDKLVTLEARKRSNNIAYKFWKEHIEKSEFTIRIPSEYSINHEMLWSKGEIDLRDLIAGYKKQVLNYRMPFVFVGAQNRGYTENLCEPIDPCFTEQDTFYNVFSRTFTYMIGGGLYQDELARWFFQSAMINKDFVTDWQDKSAEVATVLKMVEKICPKLQLVTESLREDGTKKYEFNLKLSDGKMIFDGISIEKLSTGFVSILKIFQEIIAGYSAWCPDEQDICSVKGVVFIDEIEAHIHVTWQSKIIRVLREMLPNTTFYLATHSPLVLSGLHENEAYELKILERESKKFTLAHRIENIEQYSFDGILTSFFGLDILKEKMQNADHAKQLQKRKLVLEMLNNMDREM